MRVADRDRKKLEEFFAGSWPARVMVVGVAKESINDGKLGIRHWTQEATLKRPLLTSHTRGYDGQ